MEQGKPKREDHEYERQGKCALFLAVEPLAGFRHVWVRSQRTMLDFAVILKALVDDIYPDADKIVLVAIISTFILSLTCINATRQLKPGELPRRSSGTTHRFMPVG